MATTARHDATTALLDASESLLVEVGYAGITVRRLAERAGVNHGLVHYYFGSMEEVFLQTLERFTDRLIERQRGEPLLRRVLDAGPLARRQVAGLRFVVVAGPRIDPARLPRRRGAQVVGYLPDLHRHLAACDLAVVQGGLTTCMELTANRRPFIYVPLRNHFEQNFHVRHRLDRYRAGRCMTYDEASDPDALAAAIADEIGRTVDYRPVAGDGAARAAALIAALL